MALVGPSGCGKTTVMKLVPRIYDTNGGVVSLSIPAKSITIIVFLLDLV